MNKRTYKNTDKGIAWLCIAIGMYISATSIELLPLDKTALHAPTWVLFISGVVFIITGVMILVKHNSKLNSILAAILLIIMGSVGFWIAFYSPAENITGGIPFIPDKYNIIIARVVFGSGALITFLISGYIIRKLLNKNA